MKIKHIALFIGLIALILGGCSNEEAKQLEAETEEATEESKDAAKGAADKVKEELPILIQNMKDTYEEGEKAIKDNTLQKGDFAIVEKDSYLALTPETYEELYQLIEINDEEGVKKIVNEEKVLKTSQGSEAEILERDIRRTKVRMKDSGQEGYLPTTLLEPKK